MQVILINDNGPTTWQRRDVTCQSTTNAALTHVQST